MAYAKKMFAIRFLLGIYVIHSLLSDRKPMDHKEDVVCEQGLRFNEHLGIIDTKSHRFHLKEHCTKCLLAVLCSGCNEEKKKSCETKKIFEKFLE